MQPGFYLRDCCCNCRDRDLEKEQICLRFLSCPSSRKNEAIVRKQAQQTLRAGHPQTNLSRASWYRHSTSGGKVQGLRQKCPGGPWGISCHLKVTEMHRRKWKHFRKQIYKQPHLLESRGKEIVRQRIKLLILWFSLWVLCKFLFASIFYLPLCLRVFFSLYYFMPLWNNFATKEQILSPFYGGSERCYLLKFSWLKNLTKSELISNILITISLLFPFLVIASQYVSYQWRSFYTSQDVPLP